MQAINMTFRLKTEKIEAIRGFKIEVFRLVV